MSASTASLEEPSEKIACASSPTTSEHSHGGGQLAAVGSGDDRQRSISLENATKSTSPMMTEEEGSSCIRQPWHSCRRRPTRLVVGRLIFFTFLAVSATLLAYVAHYYLMGSEKHLAETQFESVAERALTEARASTLRNVMGVVSVASLFSSLYPNADRWPNVLLPNYNEVVMNIIKTMNGLGVYFHPFVTPDQLESFEEFAYNYFDEVYGPGRVGTSSFGKGVFAWNHTLNTSDDRYHDTSGRTIFCAAEPCRESPYVLLIPGFQVIDVGPQPGETPNDTLLWNLRSGPSLSRYNDLDELIACGERRTALIEAGKSIDSIQCRHLLHIEHFFITQPQDGPGAVLMQPIYPRNSTVMTGLLTSILLWRDVLQNAFPPEVSGVTCVLNARDVDHKKYIYTIRSGVAEYVGQKNFSHDEKHGDKKYSHLAASISLSRNDEVEEGPPLFSNISMSYTMTLCPNDEFFASYQTGNVEAATAGVILTIVLTSLAFVMYDCFVRKEMHRSRAVLEAKRKFMRFVSHEVRTPLNMVCMGLELIEESGASAREEDGSMTTDPNAVANKPQNEILSLARQVRASAESAVDILNDLLNYDRVETGTLNLEHTIVPIWNLVERMAIESKLPCQSQNVQLSVNFYNHRDPEVPVSESAAGLSVQAREQRVIGDTGRITQVFRNLMSNSLKFTKDGGSISIDARWLRAGSHEASLHRDSFFRESSNLQEFCLTGMKEPVAFLPSGLVQISVTDSGVGMNKEQLKKVFGQGVQFNASQLQDGRGSGLGLFIAKGIIDQHGGTLTVQSKGLGHGSSFTVTLPLHHVPDAVLPSHLEHLRLERPISPRLSLEQKRVEVEKNESLPAESEGCFSGSLHILIVDDASLNRKLLSRLLEKRNHSCDQAADGAEAVEKVKQSLLEGGQRYHTVLLDFEMPVMNGPSAAAQIRKLGCDVLIVGITGNVLPEDVHFFEDQGANCVMAKPLQMQKLEAIWVERGLLR